MKLLQTNCLNTFGTRHDLQKFVTYSPCKNTKTSFKVRADMNHFGENLPTSVGHFHEIATNCLNTFGTRHNLQKM